MSSCIANHTQHTHRNVSADDLKNKLGVLHRCRCKAQGTRSVSSEPVSFSKIFTQSISGLCCRSVMVWIWNVPQHSHCQITDFWGSHWIMRAWTSSSRPIHGWDCNLMPLSGGDGNRSGAYLKRVDGGSVTLGTIPDPWPFFSGFLILLSDCREASSLPLPDSSTMMFLPLHQEHQKQWSQLTTDRNLWNHEPKKIPVHLYHGCFATVRESWLTQEAKSSGDQASPHQWN